MNRSYGEILVIARDGKFYNGVLVGHQELQAKRPLRVAR